MTPPGQHLDSSDEKEKILGRIREALRVPAPRPGHAHHSSTQQQSADLRTFLPAAPEDFAKKLELFKSNATALKADFSLLETKDELVSRVKALRESEGWTRIATHSGELTDSIRTAIDLPVCRTDVPYEAGELETCSVGITQCDALVAQTGSVLVTSRSAGGRALSVLPPHHVVLARRDQLLRDLPEAFSLLKKNYAPDYPSFISFITGPSRTGDIERILVLGAHGPKKLTILCL